VTGVTFFYSTRFFKNSLATNNAYGGIDTLYLMRYTFILIIMKMEISKKSTHAQKWGRGLTSGLKRPLRAVWTCHFWQLSYQVKRGTV